MISKKTKNLILRAVLTAALCVGVGVVFAQTTRMLYTDSTGTNIGIGTTTPQGALVVTNGNVGIGTWTAADRLTVMGGNVGIGVTATSALLHVAGSKAIFGPNNGNFTLEIFQGGAGGNFIVELDNSEKMRINNNGNVGIGSAAPGQTLDVTGNIRASGTISGTSGANGWSTGTGTVYTTTGSDKVGIGTTTPQGAFVVTNGNVGIGTWAPTSLLAVGANAFTVSAAGAISASTGITTSGGYTQSGTSANTFTGTPTFSNATNSAFFTGGNVGIGSTAPGTTLDVTGTARVSGATTFNGATATFNNDNFYAQLQRSGTAFGYLGTGSNVVSGSAVTDLGIRAENNLAFSSGGSTERMRITSAGNVGIGTTVPTAKLDVYTGGENPIIAWTAGPTGQQANTRNWDIRSNWEGHGTFDVYHSVDNSSAPSVNVLSFSGITGAATFPAGFAGNVGIGSTAPQQNLVVNAGSASLTKHILLVKGGGSSGNYGLDVQANNGDELFRVDTLTYNTLLAINSAGNVGIGTTIPATLLEVAGAGGFRKSTNGIMEGVLVKNVNSGTAATSQVRMSDDVNGSLNLMYIGAGYNTSGIHIANSSVIDADSAGGLNLGATATTGTIKFYTNGLTNERMRIDSAGSVGIKKTPGTWHSSYAGNGILQIGAGGAIWTDIAADDLFIGSNYYIPASGAETYIGTGKAANIYIVGGNFNFRNTDTSGTADGTITWATPLKITSAGNVGIGSAAPGKLLDVAGIARATGGVLTKTGNVTLNSGVATTMFSAATNGMYIVMALIDGGVNSNYTAEAIIISNNGTPIIMQQVNGALLTITLSGANVQTTQNSGASSAVTWSYVLIPY